MRLHALRVQALQAFATTAEVDFDALSDAGLFLLHGPTGAGKTTLLDAVCFALFGKLPGARGSDARERADLAAADLPTEVMLELTLRGERIRITRTPRQERPKQRGTGTTAVQPTVRLEAIDADGGVRVLASRVDEAAVEIERLLGMNREQFCQVVLLPQGQFATFLHARSDEREELLARLFGTERFEHAERWLTERRKRMEEALRAALQELRDTASKLEQVLGAEAPDGWEDEPARLAGWADAAQVLADADQATASGHKDDMGEARKAAESALAGVRQLIERRERHRAAVQALAAHEAARGERDAAQATLDLARAAAVVAPLLEVAAAAARDADIARTEADAALATLEGADRDPAALRASAAGLRTAAGEAAALAPIEEAARERAAHLQEGERQRVGLQAELDALTETLASSEAEREALEAAAEAGTLAMAQREAHAAASHAAADRVIAALRRDALAGEIDRHRAARLDAVQAEQDARAALLDVRQRRIDGMAAELAFGLEDGAPCLVCGALEHPEPAAHRIGDRVEAAAEQEAQARLDQLREERERLDGLLADATAARAAALAVAGDDDVARLQHDAEDAEARSLATAAAADGAEAAIAALAQHAGLVATREARRSAVASELAALTARLETWGTAQATESSRLAAALAGAPSVQARVRTLTAAAVAREEAAAAVERAAERAAAAAETTARAAAAATAAGFASVEQARSAVRDAAGIAALEEQIRVYDETLSARRSLAGTPELVQAAAAEAPDEPGAMAAQRGAVEADALAEQALERARARAEALRTLRIELARRIAALGPVAEETARVRHLATLVDGTSSQNRKRMRLRAYVLAARLEEIAAAATERLLQMSDGRYALELDDERASNNRRSGLGLRVVDGWTGRDRRPASLSGGETFMASLALALGLADVVAAEAGGARLETLFVDEGFGSLDERALDNALEVLDRLRDGGRAVGVVSHVPELRQRITAQLHVVKDRQGSRVVQVV